MPFFALPGVPAEMREMWQGYLLAALRGMGGGGRVILRRNIKCFGAGESQVESLMPDLIRRGRIPRVGINASRATIILRIVAEGDSEEQCRAQIEPTVAEIHKHLGTLVFGEGDDELQDVVLRLLASAARPWPRPKSPRPGWSPNGWQGWRQWRSHYRGGLVAADEAAMTRLLPLGSAASSHGEAGSSVRWRSLAANGFKPISAWRSAPCPVRRRRVKPGRSISLWPRQPACRPFTFLRASIPTSSVDYCAKHAINLARLALLKQEDPAEPLPARPAGE